MTGSFFRGGGVKIFLNAVRNQESLAEWLFFFTIYGSDLRVSRLHGGKKASEPIRRICRQPGAEDGRLFYGIRQQGGAGCRRFLGMAKAERERAADAEWGQKVPCAAPARRHIPADAGRAGGAAVLGPTDDLPPQARGSVQGRHAGEDMIHLAEKGIHEAFALPFIQAEFFQEHPDAFAGKTSV